MAGPPPPPPGQEAPRYQEWILDTIDSLRSRKARPDLERICRMVRRRHGPEPERTRAELEKLIQQRAVLRVSYKGSISYRNAARVQPPRRGAPAPAPAQRPGGTSRPHRASPPGASPAAPRSPRAPVPAAPRSHRAAPRAEPAAPPRRTGRERPPPPAPPAPEEVAPERSSPVSLREIVRYLGGDGSAAGGGRVTRGRVQGLLEEEVARGRLERTRFGSIALARAERGPQGRAPHARAHRSKKAGEEPSEEKGEEEEEDDEASTMSEGSEAPDYEGAGAGAGLESDGKAAPAEQSQMNGDCKDSRRGGKDCPTGGGHARDLHPPEEHSPDKGSERPHREGSERRHAKACSPGESACQQFGMGKKEGGSYGQPDRAVSPAVAGADPPVPLSPGRPGVQAADGTLFSCVSVKKEKPSDPVEWTVMDVVDYFTEAGFAEQASAFQEQEIDGKSLLLMQRTDVLTGLSIRLGPALKIYEYHIKVLQQSHFEEDEVDSFLG
ncbi:sterile alpha motif domain-containing protein 1-like [Malaclemys terrapin pileata]|uniref:sterile alpha motif domain-containing protein 1-like n=1 Tax=Malaclemys terrapin pileata TaxID=2991368 RepID=UPI0023A8A957|nr:sterile alpha motif domain-containing protein 1-like [Malaclemys terrapin pileata]